MRSGIVSAAALMVVLCAPGPARSAGLDGLWRGLNGILTFPADPFCDAVFPPEDFEDFPARTVIRHPFGFVHGTVLGVLRAAGGVADVALTPLWVIPSLSPEPRFDVIPFYDLEETR